MNEINMVPWIGAFGIIAVITIIGNLLFLFVFFKSDKIRRMHTSLLLINLTAADLIVGTVAIPMYMAVLWPGSEEASKALIQAYNLIDVLSGFASLFGLTAIALERVYSVFWPHKHRALSKTPYCVAVIASWLVAALQVILKSLEWSTVITLLAFFHCIFFLLTAVVIIIIVSYFTVWIIIKKKLSNSDSSERRIHQERKLVVTLAIVTGIFLVTWLPFHVVNIIYNLCKPCRDKLPFYLVYASKLLHYSNSLVNPVVYSFRFPEVRRTLANIFCRRKLQMVARSEFRMTSRRQEGGERGGN